LLHEVAALRLAVMQTRAQRPFKVDGWVALPDHMHCIWTLPAGDADYSTRMEYCRINPVKYGLVDDPQDWPYTSFR
jgi:hypothetical protein